MKKNIISLSIIINLFFLLPVFSQPVVEWEKRYNNPVNGEDDAYSIDIDQFGNSYVTGRTYNGSNYDIATVKYDQNGNQVWLKTYNGNSNVDDIPKKIQTDKQNNVFLAATVNLNNNQDEILFKYDENGNQLWNRKLYDVIGRYSYISSMDVDKYGNIFAWLGILESPYNAFLLIKFNTNGDTLWTRKVKDTLVSGSNPVKVICDTTGNIYTLGSYGRLNYLSKFNQNGEKLWQVRRSNFNSVDFCINNAGEIFITGNYYEISGYHNYTVKYDNDGVFKWGAYYTENYAVTNSIASDISGNCYFTGILYNGNVFAIRYDSLGNKTWLKLFTGIYNGGTSKIIIENDNLYLLANLFINGSVKKIVLIKCDFNGSEIFTYQYTHTSQIEDIPYDFKVKNCNIFITGKSMSPGTHFDFLTLKLSQPIGIQPVSTEIPEYYSLSQNYPNPFNPSTKIKFEIPAGSKVAQTFLSVHDMLGKEIAILVNEKLNPGTYEVDWNAANYPSGVYFYKLVSGGFSQTRKMVLIK